MDEDQNPQPQEDTSAGNDDNPRDSDPDAASAVSGGRVFDVSSDNISPADGMPDASVADSAAPAAPPPEQRSQSSMRKQFEESLDRELGNDEASSEGAPYIPKPEDPRSKASDLEIPR